MRVTMRKHTYEVNPERLYRNPAWTKLSLVHRAIFREILDILWGSEKQYRMPYDPNTLSEKLGVSTDDLEHSLAMLTIGDDPLLVEEFDLGGEGFYLSSPMLREQIADHQRWLREERHRVSLKNKEREESLSLVARIQNAKSPKLPHVAYLKPEQRDLSVFHGWLPTNRFDTQGQVYYVRENFKAMLIESYPDQDVDQEILKIHAWLCNNPFRRKALAYMNRFILNWLENQADQMLQEGGSNGEMEQELDSLLGLTNHKAASV